MPQLEELLQQAAKLEKKNSTPDELAKVYRSIATQYHKQGNKEKNAEFLKKAKESKAKVIEKEPVIVDSAEVELDKILAVTDNVKKHSALERFVEKHPKFTQGYFELASISVEMRYFEQAKSNYLKFIANVTDNESKAIAFNNLANILKSNYFKQYNKAKEYYENALQLKPNYPSAFNNLANLLGYEFHEYDSAKVYYEKAISFKSDYYEANNNLANLLCKDHFKQYKTAEEYFKKAIQINPEYAEVYHNIAVLYFYYLKDDEKAKYYFAKAIELNKNLLVSRAALIKMTQTIPFLSEIRINNLRHLANKSIKINQEEFKTLIITGKNGSGKTTILNECRDVLKRILETSIDQLFSEKGRNEIFNPIDSKLDLIFNTGKQTDLRLAYETGLFVVKYFNVQRQFKTTGVDTIKTTELTFENRIDSNWSDNIVAYLVDLDFARLRAFRENDSKTVSELDAWFNNFTEILKEIDKGVVGLKYSASGNKHNFILKVKLPDERIIDVKFEDLPDGFKATFKIVFEIMLQMQSKVQTTYDLPGIVMIDEPELFLHIEMQKRIMPALIKLFPRIQFLVATHSPFILSSIENAVIYDLEKDWRFENASQLSYSGLVEYYFKQDEHSDIIKKDINRFEELVQKTVKEEDDIEEIADLDERLKKLSPLLSPMLYLQYKKARKAIQQ